MVSNKKSCKQINLKIDKNKIWPRITNYKENDTDNEEVEEIKTNIREIIKTQHTEMEIKEKEIW